MLEIDGTPPLEEVSAVLPMNVLHYFLVLLGEC